MYSSTLKTVVNLNLL